MEKEKEIFMNKNMKLVGVTFGDCQQNINNYGHACIRYFNVNREPDNPHDPNAVWVGLGTWKFGYIPKGTAKEIAPLMDSGSMFEAEFVSRNVSPFHDTVGLTIKLIPMQAVGQANTFSCSEWR